jgi:hypothetical protein
MFEDAMTSTFLQYETENFSKHPRYSASDNLVALHGIEPCPPVFQTSTLRSSSFGFLDDDNSKRGVKIKGVKVLGTISELERITSKIRIDCVVLAILSANGSVLRCVFEQCGKCRGCSIVER